MSSTNLPALPPKGALGPEVCATMQLYIAVSHDLPVEQARVVAAHVQICRDCAWEQRLASRATTMVASLDTSAPSPRVDEAVMAAIAARSGRNVTATRPAQPLPYKPKARKRAPLRIATGLVAAAAVFVVAMLTSAHMLPGFPLPGSLTVKPAATRQVQPQPQAAFDIPKNLSWNNYVLYNTQTMTNAKGERYQITAYNNLAEDVMNVETVMDGKLDVVVVMDDHRALGLDMMHNVAQWKADSWGVDESMFDLAQLRSDLQAKHAVYLGKDTFNGQSVYRIRLQNGLVLLLDMQYQPVNVLRSDGSVVYDKFQLVPHSKMPESMWDMSVPKGFKLGKLPKKP
jgi:hypothetical protein